MKLVKISLSIFLPLIFIVTSCQIKEPEAKVSGIDANTNSTTNDFVKQMVFDGDVNGCNDFYVYRATQDKTKVLVVSGDSKKLKVSNKPQTFEIGKTDTLYVFILDYISDTYDGQEELCYDSIKPEGPLMRYQA